MTKMPAGNYRCTVTEFGHCNNTEIQELQEEPDGKILLSFYMGSLLLLVHASHTVVKKGYIVVKCRSAHTLLHAIFRENIRL